MKRKLLSLTFLLSLTGALSFLNAQSMVVFTGAEPLSVLLFCADSAAAIDGDATTQPGDSRLYDFFTADDNIDLTVKHSLTATDKDDYDVIYVSTTISSSNAAPLKDPGAGVVIAEAYAFKSGAMDILKDGNYHNLPGLTNASDAEQKDSPTDELIVVSDAYRLSAGFIDDESVVIYDDVNYGGGDAAEWYNKGGVEANGGQIVATFPEMSYIPAGETEPAIYGADTCVAIFAIEEGTQLAESATPRAATSNIVGWFFTDQTAAVATDDAMLMLQAAIYWAGNSLDQNVGIGRQFASQQLIAYPNPTSGSLYLELETGNYELSIYTIAGQLVRKIGDVNNKHQLSVEDLDTGVYVLKAVNGNKVQTLRFVKQ